jgi:hypothetical protein
MPAEHDRSKAAEATDGEAQENGEGAQPEAGVVNRVVTADDGCADPDHSEQPARGPHMAAHMCSLVILVPLLQGRACKGKR